MAEGGLLDFLNSPGGMGLLSAVGAGLAGARRGGTLNALGSGLLGGVQGFAQGQNLQQQQQFNQQRQKLFDSQVAENDLQAQARKQALEMQQRQRDYLGTLGKVTSPRLDAQPNKFDPMQALALGMSPEMVKTVAEAPNLGRAEVARTLESQDAQGNKITLQFDKFGRPVGEGVQGYTAPVQVDTGSGIQFVAPKVGVILPKSLSPEARASNAVAWFNAKTSRDRLAFDQGGGAEVGGNQAAFNKQFGKAPAGFRWKADGSMEFIPGGPADQKAQLQKSGEGTVASVIADLRDKYNVLDSQNAIVSEKNKVGTNLGAWLGSTGFGQTVGGAVGTKAQSARDSIAMTRPLLLQAIMKATGMSAKQMDSNAEMKMYLATATDPTLGLQANMEALNRLESLYGGGSQDQAPAAPPANPKPQQANAPKQGQVVDGYVFRGGDPSDSRNWAKVK